MNNCENCGNLINAGDDFCPDCGSLFIDNIKCSIHPEIDAKGVCVICTEPYCKTCLGRSDEIFLCNKHSNYEIIEGFAKVFGTQISTEAEYVQKILDDENFHTYLFKRKASPIHMGYENHTLFRASGEKPGHSVNEYKVMVPLQEVIAAEEIINKIEKKL